MMLLRYVCMCVCVDVWRRKGRGRFEKGREGGGFVGSVYVRMGELGWPRKATQSQCKSV
jgi:hypothetical protein